MATSQIRARPRKAGADTAVTASKTPAARKESAAAKKTVARKTVAKAIAKPALAKKAVAKKAAVGKPVAKKTAAGVTRVAAEKSVATPSATRKPATTRRSSAPAAKAPGQPPRSRSKARPAQTPDMAERLHNLVIAALDDLKAKDVQEIDVRGKSSVTDLMVLASGTSSRHVKSIADEVVKKAKQAGLPPIGVEGQREGEWVLVDLGDVIVHVMLPRTREFYGLERLWTVGDDGEIPAALAG